MTESIPDELTTNTTVNARYKLYPRLLLIIFIFSLPLINPIVHGDGVGYYAYARAPLIQHDLRFEEDWRRANLYFAQSRTQPDGQILPDQFTETGYVSNLFTVGPAILWTPFLAVAHGVVLIADHFGAHIPADGFSLPYRLAMAFGTAFYGFLGLFLSYTFASKYVQPKWAFLATVGIWTASSLPVYMYFNPAWSHAHSAFTVALFLWYWERTQSKRTLVQWLTLGAISGLALDVYFPNGVFLLLCLIQSLRSYWRSVREKNRPALQNELMGNLLYLTGFCVAILPTLITRRIIFGGLLRFGAYTVLPWDWSAPNWRSVLFSSEHGLLTWTPVLFLAVIGLFLAARPAKGIAAYFGVSLAAFYYVIASYPFWHGMSSFGNRFFISNTPIFVFGLALFFQYVSSLFRSSRTSFVALAALVALFAVWNGSFIFQWGTHLIPVRGPISWSEMVHNQFYVVPRQITSDLQAYLFRRHAMMEQLEQRDIEQLKKETEP
jgi:hypothetical protein